MKIGGEGSQEIGAAARSGQRESGLSDAEVAQLTSILTPYFVKRSIAVDAVQQLKRYGDMPRVAEMFNKWIADGEQAPADFGKKYGEAALKAVDAAEPEYFAIQNEMVQRALGRKK